MPMVSSQLALTKHSHVSAFTFTRIVTGQD
jgi:hypothetical protein